MPLTMFLAMTKTPNQEGAAAETEEEEGKEAEEVKSKIETDYG